MLHRTQRETPSILLHPHHDGRIVVRPIADPERPIDVTETVIRCIASAIGEAVGGNPVLNRLEAERTVHDLTQTAKNGVVEASR